ncbi:MAG: T9SS type A sorting domain-containing protein [Flavobacteriales bacterium]|nr:T9SS type A sorting domain-containing protein [Flavobacteriales bacterium]
MKRILLFIISSFASFSFSQSTFTVTTTGTTSQIDSAINYATNIWSQYLNSTVPIKLNVIYTNLGATVLGTTLPNGRTNFTGAPDSEVGYPTSLANSISGVELNPGEFDMDIYMNSSSNWYFGLDGNAGAQVDFVTVFLHEMVHGLGGISFGKVENNLGSFGMLTLADIPLPTSFSVNFEPGVHTIWDNFLINGNNQDIVDSLIFQNISNALANEIQSGDIYFNGPNATAANAGVYPKIYAPAAWTIGSSLHHFDEVTFPQGDENELFTPFLSGVSQFPGPVLLGALVDIGWDINSNVGLDKHGINEVVVAYPNPASDIINIKFVKGVENLMLTDLQGKIVLGNLIQGKNNLRGLNSGNYILSGTLNKNPFSQIIMIN